MTFADLWTEASTDHEQEAAQRAFTAARVAAVPSWSFLALARSDAEFEHRLALAVPAIQARAGLQSGAVIESFRADWIQMTASDAKTARVSEDVLNDIQSRDPDGGSTRPTEQDYAAHKAWAISRHGQEAWDRYSNGEGWGHQPGDDPRHVESSLQVHADGATCPACGGSGMELGQIGQGSGQSMHYRCRNCGMDFTRTPSGMVQQASKTAGRDHNQNLQHRLREDTHLAIHYPADTGMAVIHAPNCSHAGLGSSRGHTTEVREKAISPEEAATLNSGKSQYRDDYYEVAPCARERNRNKTSVRHLAVVMQTTAGENPFAKDDEDDAPSEDSDPGDSGSDDSSVAYYVVDEDSGKDLGGPYDSADSAQAAIDAGDFDADGDDLSVEKGAEDGGPDNDSDDADDDGDGEKNDEDDDSDSGNPFAKASALLLEQAGLGSRHPFGERTATGDNPYMQGGNPFMNGNTPGSGMGDAPPNPMDTVPSSGAPGEDATGGMSVTDTGAAPQTPQSTKPRQMPGGGGDNSMPPGGASQGFT